MRIIRIFFTKTGEAAYISHLDLQRVMARALRRSGLPVWYSQGFNPHIYMSFALPLPLGQESLAEAVDCKTESEEAGFSQYIEPLNKALPRGIVATGIGMPQYPAAEIAWAEYGVQFAAEAETLQTICTAYNDLPQAVVIRKTKRKETPFDLKTVLPQLEMAAGDLPLLSFRLPAGGGLNINPELLIGFLSQELGFAQRPQQILRKKVLCQNGEEFI